MSPSQLVGELSLVEIGALTHSNWFRLADDARARGNPTVGAINDKVKKISNEETNIV